MSISLPYSMKDVHYDKAKFRHRSPLKVLSQSLLSLGTKRNYASCSMGKILMFIPVFGLACLLLVNKDPNDSAVDEQGKGKITFVTGLRLGKLLRLPPRLSPDEGQLSGSSTNGSKVSNPDPKWRAMGYDELMPVSQHEVDGLGGLGATMVDSLDTAMIVGLDDVVSEAGTWVETHILERIRKKGQERKESIRPIMDQKTVVYLDVANDLADCLLSAFTSIPTPVPFSDAVLHDSSSHPAPGGLSSTAEVSTLQLEFNYLSAVSAGDLKYSTEAMKVLAHIKTLPKTEGLVPICISPHTGEFIGENIRLGSRGDSYYECLMKVGLQQGAKRNSNLTYLYDMYLEAMKGVRHLLVHKSMPNGLVFVGELPYESKTDFSPKMDHLVCFLPGTLALRATKGITREKALMENLLTFEDLENLELAEELTKTCFEMYEVTAAGLAPEIAYFHTEDYSGDGLDGGNKSSMYTN